MRGEWNDTVRSDGDYSAPSPRGLTRAETSRHELDRSAVLTLAHRAHTHAPRNRKTGVLNLSNREVSERRQVGDAEHLVNPPSHQAAPWWKNVGMEEGM